MTIKFGSTTINKLYLGTAEITKVYLGSTEVYSSAVPTVATYIGETSNAGSSSSYTFTAHALGTAFVGRRIVVVVHGTGTISRTISTVTIGGVNAPLSIQTASSTRVVGIAILQVDAGTTADIVVTFSGGETGAGISVFSLSGVVSSTAHDTAVTSADTTDTLTLDIPAGGCVIAAVTSTGTSTPYTFTNAVEDYDTAYDGATTGKGGGHQNFTGAAQAGYTITIDTTGAGNQRMVAASYR